MRGCFAAADKHLELYAQKDFAVAFTNHTTPGFTNQGRGQPCTDRQPEVISRLIAVTYVLHKTRTYGSMGE